MPLLTRWVSEALYRMWTNGISLVTWLFLSDKPLDQSFNQSGMYFLGPTLAAEKPKPIREAFRFPVVALTAPGGIDVWGRTPGGVRGTVSVEQRAGGRWRLLGRVTSSAAGVFERRFGVAATGYVRARFLATGERSVPFGLRPVPDRPFNPFGSTGP
jgi:hypothetical protein